MCEVNNWYIFQIISVDTILTFLNIIFHYLSPLTFLRQEPRFELGLEVPQTFALSKSMLAVTLLWSFLTGVRTICLFLIKIETLEPSSNLSLALS